jgi:murein L,D-transpeptidase YcbB/YkuD
VEDAEKLASLLLKADGKPQDIKTLYRAMVFYEPETFTLKRRIPIQTLYLSCEIVDGLIQNYEDIYNQDKALELALYGSSEAALTTKIKNIK